MGGVPTERVISPPNVPLLPYSQVKTQLAPEALRKAGMAMAVPSGSLPANVKVPPVPGVTVA